MFCKWITCTVDPGTRPAFATAQERWSVIAAEHGLIGQVGGWAFDTNRAHLLGVWDCAESYARFMRNRHDCVAEQAGHAGTYRDLAACAGPVVFSIDGDAGSLGVAIEQGTLLRVADCVVRAGRGEHFVQVQRSVWAPGMAAAGGMLAGLFTQLGPDRYRSSPTAHTRYARDDINALRQRASADDDIDALTGTVFKLEPRWRVIGPAPTSRASTARPRRHTSRRQLTNNGRAGPRLSALRDRVTAHCYGIVTTR